MRNTVFDRGEIPQQHGCAVFFVEHIYAQNLHEKFTTNPPLMHLMMNCSGENAFRSFIASVIR